MAGTLSFHRPSEERGDQAVIEVRDLVRMFGAFTAVDHVSFAVNRGEIFGLLGPNGAEDDDVSHVMRIAACLGRNAARGWGGCTFGPRFGPAADRVCRPKVFALWTALGERQPRILRQRLWFARPAAASVFNGRSRNSSLARLRDLPSGQLPGGYKQRLAMAAALLHEPEILFLDEPTSGADPLARRDFWRRITSLAAQGVTVIVTTHFMEEAEYCDRIAIMDSGRILARGSPAEIRGRARSEPTGERGSGPAPRAPSMEDAFIAIVDDSRRAESRGGSEGGEAA